MPETAILEQPEPFAALTAAARPIFVVGYQRSGTTAMYAALCQHPRLRQSPEAMKEPWFLHEFLLGRQLHHKRPDHAGGALDRAFSREFARLLDRFCRQHFARGSDRWIFGHPEDRLYLDDIFEMFPAARVLYMLRHPQESIWSNVHSPWLKFAHRGEFLSRAGLEAEWWQRSVPTVLQALAGGFAGRVLVVRHERMLAQPETTARQVLAHVGEPFAAEVARELGRVKNSSFLPENTPTAGLKGRLAQSAGDPAFCRIIAKTCGAAMRQLGYEPTCRSTRSTPVQVEEPPADRLHAYFSRHGRRGRWLAWLLGI